MSGHRPSRYSNPVGIAGSSFKDFSKLARAIREQKTTPELFSLTSCGKSIGSKGFLLDATTPQAAESIVACWKKLQASSGGGDHQGNQAINWGEAEQWTNTSPPLVGVRLLAKGVDSGVSEADFKTAIPALSRFYRHVDKQARPTSFVFFNVPSNEEAARIIETGIRIPSLLVSITDVSLASERQLVGFCYNCLRIGCHSSRCKSPVRCAHCLGSHMRKECPAKDTKEVMTNRKCINCGSTSHWGDDRKECPKLKANVSQKAAGMPAAHASHAKAVASKASRDLKETKEAWNLRVLGLEGRLTVMERSHKVQQDQLKEIRALNVTQTIALGAHLHSHQNPKWQMTQACIDACFDITGKASAILAALDKKEMFNPGSAEVHSKRPRAENAQKEQ